MAVNVETLEKLQRRITLTLGAEEIGKEVQSRLKRLSRTVKAPGFRPGKMPLSVVAQRYGYTVQHEVVNDRLGKAFAEAARQAELRVAGVPTITQNDQAPEGQFAFDATFEVYPEVRISDLSAIEIERVDAEVTEAAVDRTIEILRKQRRTFTQRPALEGAALDDRVTIDFEGTIDGEAFDGGKANDFQFVIGEGQMLEQFDSGVRAMKVGASKTFPLKFPDDYQGKDLAGREADFLVTMKKIEIPHLPDVDDALARALGIGDATVDGLRADVRNNLEREVRKRVLVRNKSAVMQALAAAAELDVPKALIDGELERMVAAARADLKQRGVKDADKAPIPEDLFRPQAERRVRIGLVLAELVRKHELQATSDQLRAHIETLAQSYEKPAEVVRWYLGDRKRMAEVEAIVVESNVTGFVLGQAKVTDKLLPFDELMGETR